MECPIRTKAKVKFASLLCQLLRYGALRRLAKQSFSGLHIISHPLQGAPFCTSCREARITDGTEIHVSEHQLRETGEEQSLGACGLRCMKNSEND